MLPFKTLVVFFLFTTTSFCYAVEQKNEAQIDPKPEEKKDEPLKEAIDNHKGISEQSPKVPEPPIEPQSKPEEMNPEVEVHEVVPEVVVHAHEEEAKPKEHAAVSVSSTSRQFQPMYQPMFPPPSGGFNMIRRQFGGGMELLGDIVMMGMIGLPILGLLTVGSSSIANFLGFGSSGSSKSSSKRNKRSLKEKAAGAVEYAKNLWDVMEQLERAFEKFDLYQDECRLRAVCEAHRKVPKMGAWGQTIQDLMRKQKELQSREILPVSRFLFSNYVNAAQAGAREEDCTRVYPECPHHLSYYISAKEDEVENEVELRMK